MGTIFSTPVQTGPGAHTASCTMGNGSFPWVKNGRGVTLTPHPTSSAVGHERIELYLYSPMGRTACTEPQCLYKGALYLYLWSRKSRAIPLLPLWAVRPVQSLSACTRMHFTFTFGHERVELYLYSPYGPYGLYRTSVPVQRCTSYCFPHKDRCGKSRPHRDSIPEPSLYRLRYPAHTNNGNRD